VLPGIGPALPLPVVLSGGLVVDVGALGSGVGEERLEVTVPTQLISNGRFFSRVATHQK
jgi:hypothetical protein